MNSNDTTKSLVEVLKPGQRWYTDAREVLHPPPTLLHQWWGRLVDLLRPRPHPLVAGARWAIQSCRRDGDHPGVEAGRSVGWASACWKYSCAALRATRWFLFRWTFVGLVGAGAVGCAMWWWRTRRLRCVRVTGLGAQREWYGMRNYFERGIARVQTALPTAVEGSHRRIAAERRGLEDLCNQWFAKNGLRYRDVGGSRTRGTEHRGLRHLCCPIIDGSDILREAKAPRKSGHHCSRLGQDCAWKDAFPGALLVHSDYYMDQDDLCDIIRGPSFIISHMFVGHEGLLHGEMKWALQGRSIVATTVDGTPYRHYYNEWQNEGVCVGKRGAFVYCLLGRTEATAVYWAYPMDGEYRSDDPNALTRSCDWPKIRLNNGRYALVTVETFQIWTNDDRHLVMSGSREILSKVELRLGGATRGPEWIATMAAYLQSRCQAAEVEITDAANLVELCAELCERYAITIYSRWNRQWSPAQMGCGTRLLLAWDRIWRYLGIMFRLPIPVSGLTRWGGRKLAPWVYRNITLACYVQDVQPDPGLDTSNSRPNARPFREQRPGDDATPDDRERGGTRSVLGEHHSERDDESAWSEVFASAMDDHDEKTSNHSVNAEHQPSTPSNCHEPPEDVQPDEVDVHSHGGAHPELPEECGSDPTQYLKVLWSGGPQSDGSASVLLDTRSWTIESNILDAPFPVPSDYGRSLVESHQELVSFMQRIRRETPAVAKAKLHSWLKTVGYRATGHTPAGTDGGMAQKRGDGVVPTARGTPRVGGLGKKVSRKAARATASGKAAGEAARNSTGGCNCKELREEGNNTQLHRSAKHQSSDRRVSRSDGPVRVSDRTRGRGVSLPDQGH
nr:MAG: VP1 protein [Drosophila Midmar tombus-like virus]